MSENADKFAAILDGREYREELSRAEDAVSALSRAISFLRKEAAQNARNRGRMEREFGGGGKHFVTRARKLRNAAEIIERLGRAIKRVEELAAGDVLPSRSVLYEIVRSALPSSDGARDEK